MRRNIVHSFVCFPEVEGDIHKDNEVVDEWEIQYVDDRDDRIDFLRRIITSKCNNKIYERYLTAIEVFLYSNDLTRSNVWKIVFDFLAKFEYVLEIVDILVRFDR